MTTNQAPTSLLDSLPFDIQLNIFKQKHELDFKPVLNIIAKLHFVTTIKHSLNVFFEIALKNHYRMYAMYT